MSDGVHIEKLLFKTGDWMKRSLAMPSLAEQQKIAEILSIQDKLIALKEKLVEEKKRQKSFFFDKVQRSAFHNSNAYSAKAGKGQGYRKRK